MRSQLALRQTHRPDLSHLHEEAVGVEPRQEDVLQDVTDTLLLEPEGLGSHN